MPLEKAAEALAKLANKVGNPIRIVLKPWLFMGVITP